MKRLFPLLVPLAALSLFACPRARATAPSHAAAADPVVSDGDKYRLLFDSDCVRLLEYHDTSGAKTHMHEHPPFVLYALAPFRRRLTFPDGSTRERTFSAGESSVMPAQRHVGENIGSTDTHALIVEMKPCRSAPAD